MPGRNYPIRVRGLAEGGPASGQIEIRKTRKLAPVAATDALPNVG